MQIIMPRGDIKKISFFIKDKNGVIVDTDFDEIYITFKKNHITNKVLFQKRLSTEDIIKDATNHYHFVIKPEDTENLYYGNYVFDIELVFEHEIKTTFIGKLQLTQEATFVVNEEG